MPTVLAKVSFRTTSEPIYYTILLEPMGAKMVLKTEITSPEKCPPIKSPKHREWPARW